MGRVVDQQVLGADVRVVARDLASIAHWVDDATYASVEAAAASVGSDRIRPVFDALGGGVDFDAIRLVLAHLRVGAYGS